MTDAEIAAALGEILAEGRRILRKYLIADEHDRKGGCSVCTARGPPRPGRWQSLSRFWTWTPTRDAE